VSWCNVSCCGGVMCRGVVVWCGGIVVVCDSVV